MIDCEMTLKLVLTYKWFDKIDSGRKLIEYRKASEYWKNRIILNNKLKHNSVEFRRGYVKNAKKMRFEIYDLKISNGIDTDLKIDEEVFCIYLGKREY